ncbi:hypothetical protein O4H52_03085 [Sphingomonadaceae bacterium G21617-S1]|nr:hypothetical protein [Sphingomonadaceae bacterium G21617-S1]
MAENIIRITNTAILVKVETTEGVDAAPVAADAIPFESNGYSYNLPYASEANNEATGSLVAGAPDMIGQPFEVSINVRLKGAAATYTSMIKPPHHALLSIAGYRGLFTAAVAAAALAAGTTTTATLGTGFSSTTRAYIGMPLIMSGVAAGATPLVIEYTSGKVATLSDLFGVALADTSSAAIPANWTYANTSPQDPTDRLTDHPAGTVYIYEDGTLIKGIAMRATLDDISASTAKAGFAVFKLKGIFGGKTDASIPDGIDVPAHSAPTLVQGPSGISPAFSLKRAGLAISSFSIKDQAGLESPDDPNTAYGFGPGLIGGRVPMLSCDPLARLVAVRDTLADLGGGAQYPGAIRFLGTAGNRIAITLPKVQQTGGQPGTRGDARSEQNDYRLLRTGVDAQSRDTDKVICFY